MMLIRIQGIVFIIIAILLTLISFKFDRLEPLSELKYLSILIFILGVPHGALDTLFAKQEYNVKTLKEWVSFGIVYIIISGLILCLWYLSSIVFFLGFLLISGIHFAVDLNNGTPWFSRILYGGAIIILPALFHSHELTYLFGFFIEEHTASFLCSTLNLMAGPWLIALIFATIHQVRIDILSGLEIAAVGLIAVILPPLTAFTIFFCCMHSTRHILRMVTYSKMSFVDLLKSMTIPMILLLAIALIFWGFSQEIRHEGSLLQFIFVGLAALTVPHMMLVARVGILNLAKGE